MERERTYVIKHSKKMMVLAVIILICAIGIGLGALDAWNGEERWFTPVGIALEMFFLWVICYLIRWKIKVDGEEITYCPSIGRARKYQLSEIDHCALVNVTVYAYGKQGKLFPIIGDRENAERLVQQILDRGIKIEKG